MTLIGSKEEDRSNYIAMPHCFKKKTIIWTFKSELIAIWSGLIAIFRKTRNLKAPVAEVRTCVGAHRSIRKLQDRS